MRQSLLTLLATAALVSAARDGCLHAFDKLSITNSCGDDLAIAKCLALHVSLESLDQIEQCFIAGGCDAADSLISAVWFAHECNANVEVEEEQQKQDLKKRATTESTDTTTAAAATTTDSTSSETSTSAAATTTDAATTDATTTTSSTSSSSSSTTASSTTSSSTDTTTTSGTTTTSTSSSSSSNTCFATESSSTSTCSFWTTGTSSGATMGCTATYAVSSSCAERMICTTDTSGGDVCMVKDNTLTTSGLAVTIAFALGIGFFIVGLCVMNAKERKQEQAQAKEREALLDKESAAFTSAAGGRGGEAGVPLIAGAARSETYKPEGFGADALANEPRRPDTVPGANNALGQDTGRNLL